LLRKWQQQGKVEAIDRKLAVGKVEGKRRWYVNGQRQTLVVVPPGKFETGVGAKRQKVRIERRFALAAREVTVKEFRDFRNEHDHNKQLAPTEDCPVNQVSWYDAAAYCNWLSDKEGIPTEQWCYMPKKGKDIRDWKNDSYAEGMKVKANALRLSGYRLPTEAEWEYACRAWSVTTWSLGEADDLLGKYAWYSMNSPSRSRPVGLKRPNELGLFDLHGNTWEWCHNRFVTFMDIKDPQEDDIVKGDPVKGDIVEESIRPLRGGAFGSDALDVRSASRFSLGPASHDNYAGFRPARTFVPDYRRRPFHFLLMISGIVRHLLPAAL
jgi:formylglycine-generating enzyme required for sulfatase activity